MRRVIQTTAEDCGAACVAMLAGVSLKKAYNAVYGELSGGLTYTRDLRDALRQLGRRPAFLAFVHYEPGAIRTPRVARS